MPNFIIKKLPTKLLIKIIFNLTNKQINKFKYHLPPNQISIDLINLLYDINNPPKSL